MTTEPAAPSTATALRRERQMALYRRALESLPGGTNSNFRAWGDDTIYIDRGQGRDGLGPRRQRVHRPAAWATAR